MNKAITILEQINNNKALSQLYNRINPNLFDVTLRDGIQTMKSMDIIQKIQYFNNINTNMSPKKIEVGSLVSNKILPIMSDTPEFYKHCVDKFNFIDHDKRIDDIQEIEIPDIYILIPPTEKKINQAKLLGAKNISIMSSVSDSFMYKNTRTSIDDVKKSFQYFDKDNNIKVYLSCISECPIDGKINNEQIIKEISFYSDNHKKYNINELCLSDTCGTLTFNDYKYIIDTCLTKNVSANLLSLHLHIDNISEVQKIIRYSLLNNINSFDVSALDNGGCSVTINNPNHNLTYDLFYDILLSYMIDILISCPPNTPTSSFISNFKDIYTKRIYS
jgi:hypothetical protein